MTKTKSKQRDDKHKLIYNTFMLYLLTGSNYFFGLITMPYLSRVLGPELYGHIGFGSAFESIVQLILDFGFIISGTMAIAKIQDDLKEVERVCSAVTYAKLSLVIPTMAAVLVLCNCVDRFQQEPLLFIFYALYAVCITLMPDFLYRGLEDMRTITVRSVLIKIFFVICIYIFVREPEQYYLVPVFYFLGAFGGLIAVIWHQYHVIHVRYIRVPLREILIEFKSSAMFFLSRVAGQMLASFNTLLLGFIYPTGPTTGYYTSANNVINAGRNAITPVSSSVFPHMVKTKNFNLLFKVIFFGEIILCLGCLPVGIFAPQICELIFGKGYAPTGDILRILLPILPISLATYLIGWSALGALGLERFANYSVFVGAAFQVALLGGLYLVGQLNVLTIAAVTTFDEAVILTLRAVAFGIGLKRYNKTLQ